MSRPFEKGDRVIPNTSDVGPVDSKKCIPGIIFDMASEDEARRRGFNRQEHIGVKHDENVGGHELGTYDEYCIRGYGYYYDAKDLDLIEPVKDTGEPDGINIHGVI